MSSSITVRVFASRYEGVKHDSSESVCPRSMDSTHIMNVIVHMTECDVIIISRMNVGSCVTLLANDHLAWEGRCF
jgi:hypothetical protein